MSNAKPRKEARHVSNRADWRWLAKFRLYEAVEPKTYTHARNLPPSHPYRWGANCGHTLATLAYLRAGQSSVPREMLALVNIPVVRASQSKKYMRGMTNHLFDGIWGMGYNDLREFFRGVADAIEATVPNPSQAALVNFIYAQYPTEVADMVRKGEKIAAITFFINKHLPKGLRVSAASVKKVLQRHNLPRPRASRLPH